MKRSPSQVPAAHSLFNQSSLLESNNYINKNHKKSRFPATTTPLKTATVTVSINYYANFCSTKSSLKDSEMNLSNKCILIKIYASSNLCTKPEKFAAILYARSCALIPIVNTSIDWELDVQFSHTTAADSKVHNLIQHQNHPHQIIN